MDCYKNFNKSLKFFMRELMSLYPNMGELKLLFSFYKVMKTVSKKSPQKYFHEVIYPHHAKLLNKNIEFLMNEDLFEDPSIKKMVMPLKEEYLRMTQQNKDMIYNHIIVLYKLSLICEQKLMTPVGKQITSEAQTLQA